jgi:hypothetical protein
VTPRSNSLEDRLFHFRQWSRRRLANQLLKALDAKHFFEAVEHLDESVRVENQTVAGREFYFVRGRGRSKLGQATKDSVPRTQQVESAIRDEHCWGMASSGKHAVPELTKTRSGHGEVEISLCEPITDKRVEALQQGARSGFTFQGMQGFRVAAIEPNHDSHFLQKRHFPVLSSVIFSCRKVATVRVVTNEVNLLESGCGAEEGIPLSRLIRWDLPLIAFYTVHAVHHFSSNGGSLHFFASASQPKGDSGNKDDFELDGPVEAPIS